ncbi:MAG TPA: HAD family hydrolase [Polyangiaceae bacterium]|jgi:phosphoglycolate phosphatase-like HAD superfamily hydrolase|nr:HAD family hydrolase [Polyangiaceae bacterium]
MKPLKAVLLDVDGTLVDSNDAHAQAWLEVFRQNGFDTTFERVRELIGKGGDKLIPEITRLDPDSREGKRLSVERAAHFRKVYLPQIRAFPKAEVLLRRLSGAGLKLVVASSAKQDELRPLLEICGALPFIEQQTSSDEIEHSKPDPDIVKVALAKAKCSPAEAVMLGDTPYDVDAAAKAGVGAVALRCGGHPDATLSRALAIYDDATDLLARFETSIFAQRR